MVTDKDIKRFRKKHDLSREALAVEMSVSAQTIWRWEAGERITTPMQRLLASVMESWDA